MTADIRPALCPVLCIEGAARIGPTPLFPRVHLALQPGQWTTLLGPSGVGKSTLLRLIAGLPTGITFDGQITGQRPVALMAQDAAVVPWLSVIDNVTLGARLRGRVPDLVRARDMLDRVGLADQAHRRPPGLSGGQRQRVALARTLMEDRDVILLDEPFSALDLRARMRMQDLAMALLRGRTVLMVTHDPAEAARLSDRIVMLTPTGLHDIAPPQTPTPRAPDAPEVLTAQAVLTTLLCAPEGTPI